MLWTLQLLPIWLWPTIFLTSSQRNGPTPRNQNAQKHSISPSNWQRNRKDQLGAWNLFSNLLLNNLRMWKPLNSLMEFSHNQKVHFTMKQTLFYLIMGMNWKISPWHSIRQTPQLWNNKWKPSMRQETKVLQHMNWQDRRWQRGPHEALPHSKKKNKYGYLSWKLLWNSPSAPYLISLILSTMPLSSY